MVQNSLSALIVARNEELFVEKCLELIHPYVDEIIFVDMESEDETANIAARFPKVKMFEYPYGEPVDMGKARTYSLKQATGDWFLQVDCDEYYPQESMKKIREFVNKPGDAISARVPYHNLAWRPGFKQVLDHYPDRLYKKDVVEKYEGVLPRDMTIVKEEYRLVKHKGRGQEGVLEYDNPEDRSFWHPLQPKLDAPFFHLARTRGFNFEYNKWKKYNRNMGTAESQLDYHTRRNQWVNGLYPMQPIEVPDYIPTINIPDPKVSIIIPCYNKAKWIGGCIESCLNQTHKPYEIIVINDGSTDNSQEVIRNYEGVNQTTQVNSGVASARNAGLGKATGDYFILIDADDKLAPKFTKRCLEEIKENQVVYTDFIGMGEWEGIEFKEPEIEGLRTAQVIPSTMALCDMRCIDPFGAFDPTEHYEDYGFWIRMKYIYQGGLNFKHIAEPLCYYRRTRGSRIDTLDEKREWGQQQLRDRYGKYGVDPA